MKIRKYILSFIIAATTATASAQYTNTLYFMEEINRRNAMNPAFLPECKSYFDFILLPNFYVGAGENLLSIRDVNDINNLLSRLTVGETPRINTSLNLNILNFGFTVKPNHYITFESGINVDAVAYMPKGLFQLLGGGMKDPNQSYNFDFSSLGVDVNAYAYAGIGYAGRIAPKVTFGIKAKVIVGLANAYTNVTKLNIEASRTNWTLSSQAEANIAACVPLEYQLNEGGNIDFSSISMGDWTKIKPAGYGGAIDLGLTYEPIDNLVISAAVTDLGAVYWYQSSLTKLGLNTSVVYDGIFDYHSGDTGNISSQVTEKLEGLGKQITDSVSASPGDKYYSMLYGKFNAGIEYGVLQNKISFGLMNRLTFNNKHLYDEVTLAVNFRPCQWFKAALSYSFMNGKWGSVGLGLNLNLAGLNMFLIADYLPITWAYVNSEQFGLNNVPLPDRIQNVNLQAGMAFNIHRFARDRDRDYVPDYKDKCPDQDLSYLRKANPKAKMKDLRDKDGCALDEDKDGIPDVLDMCPQTPVDAVVDSVGCPVDTDNDGVADYQDKCPDTPEGVEVDKTGCPFDEDGDGVADYLDKCPGTPKNVIVDKSGCPVDSDNDGVPDYIDKCPETPAGIAVDANGCPFDEDSDGVADYLDKCPETPHNVAVDENGCPFDNDKDGVPDYMDKCPYEAGDIENNGCPKVEVPESVTKIFKKAMTGIQFETAKATIKKSSYPILDQIVAILELDTTYMLEISGHTDNQGDHDKNVRLSQDRAEAVMNYLINKGIDSTRLSAIGYGPDKPIADNSTKQGRSANRRVEFEIVYKTIIYK